MSGTQESGTPPSASGGPTATATAISSAIDGGSNLVALHGSAPFTQVIVSVANGAGTPPVTADTSAGSSGFFRITLPAATTDQTIVVTFGTTIQFATFDVQYQLISASGAVGAPTTVHTSLVSAGVGDVQVAVSWDQLTDVDLHVVEPNGNEIFWAQPVSSTGGQLDLDSNQACGIDGKNTENVRWSKSAPSGTYTVRLDYFLSCQISQSTNYVVTVHNGTAAPQIFTGSFSQSDQDAGTIGSGRLITTFTHTASNAATLFDVPLIPVPQPSALKLALARKR